MKNIYIKYYLVIPVVIMLFMSTYNLCFAIKWEVPLPGLNPNTGFPEYINIVIQTIFGAAALFAIIGFVRGAIMYMVSAGSPEKISDSVSIIKSSVLGTMLLLASILIMNTINLALTNPTLTDLPCTKGLGFADSSGTCILSARDSEADVFTAMPNGKGINQIKYICPESGLPPLIVHKFTGPNFPLGGATTQDLECGGSISTSGLGSYKVSIKTPGVYLYLGRNCTGFSSDAIAGDQALNEPFTTNLNSIRIVNDAKAKYNFGVIIHEGNDYSGRCIPDHTADPFISSDSCDTQKSTCYNATSPVEGLKYRSVNIFKFNDCDSKSSGDGVVFYSQPFGYDVGAKAGSVSVDSSSDDLLGLNTPPFYKNLAPQSLEFDYTGIAGAEGEEEKCQNFLDCSGSIKIKGNYRVVLYSAGSKSKNSYCEVFKENFGNLNADWLLAPEGGEERNLVKIQVFPTKD